MHFIRAFVCLLISGVTAVTPALAQQSEYFFRYRGGPVYLAGHNPVDPGNPSEGEDDGGDGEDETDPVDPGEGDPEEIALAFARLIPSSIVAGRQHTSKLEGVGGTGDYTFSVDNLPDFVTVGEDGTVTASPTMDDLGEYQGIVVTINDGVTTVVSPALRMTVRMPSESIPTPIASASYLNGVEVSRHLTYNDNTKDSITIVGNGSTLEYVYDTPFETSGAFINTSATVELQAFVEGEWQKVASGRGKKDIFNGNGQRFTSDRWRLVSKSSKVTVRSFRPAYADDHDAPIFEMPGAYAGLKGVTTQVRATRFPSRYTEPTDPVTIAFAPGTTVPAGIDLQPDGTLSVASNAAFAGEWHFTLVATDAVGFQRSQSFYVTSDAVDASTLMAHDFTFGSDAVDYRRMYDGHVLRPATAIAVTQTKALVVDFKVPVAASSVIVSLGSSTRKVVVEHESEGQWLPIVSSGNRISSGMSFGREVVASKFRLVAESATPVEVYDFRIGSGPVHTWPVLTGSQQLPSLMAIDASVRIEGTESPTYGNVVQDPVFEVVDGSLPTFLGLQPDGRIEIGEAEPEDGEWAFTVRITDAEGFTAERQYVIANSSVAASDVIPAATYSKIPDVKQMLYDGDTETSFSFASSDMITFDFGTSLAVDRAYMVKTSGNLIFEGYIDGGWREIARTGTGAINGVFEFGGSYMVQRIRMTRSGGYTPRIAELRFGAGPAHAAPAIVHDGSSIGVTDVARTIAMPASVSKAHYFPNNSLTWTVVEGELPTDASLSADGVLSLPSFHSITDEWAWEATIEVVDQAGFKDRKVFKFINTDAVPASTVYPVSVSIGDRQLLMDGVANTTAGTYIAIPAGGNLIIDYGRLVKFDRFAYAMSGAMAIEIETSPNVWEEIAQPAASNTTILTSNLGMEYATKRLRIRRTASSTAINVREFRLGAGPVHTLPTFTVAEYVGTIGASTQNIDMRASWDKHYAPARPTFTVVEGMLPEGAALSRDGYMFLPTLDSFGGEQGTWVFTVRITDDTGNYSERELIVGSTGSSPSSVLPVAAYKGNVLIEDYLRFYDGVEDTSTRVEFTPANPLTIVFDQPIQNRTVYVAGSTTGLRFEYKTVDGRWIETTHTRAATGAGNLYTFDRRSYVSREWRIVPTGTSASLGEVRIGNAPVHFNPRLSDTQVETYVVTISGSSGSATRQLSATRSSYAASHSFEIVDGTNLQGISITPAGLLSVTHSGGTPRSEAVRVRVTDDLGYWSEADYFVAMGTSSMPRASATIPVSATRGNGTNVPLTTIYVNNTTSTVTTNANEYITLDFGQVINASSVRLKFYRAVSGTANARVEFEMGGKWYALLDQNSGSLSNTYSKAFTGYSSVYASKFRVKGIDNSIQWGAFIMGNGTSNSDFPTLP